MSILCLHNSSQINQDSKQSFLMICLLYFWHSIFLVPGNHKALLWCYHIIIAGEVISEEYTLEYGRDCLEMHIGAVEPNERALVVDDLIATGGTLCAAINLLGTSKTPINKNSV